MSILIERLSALNARRSARPNEPRKNAEERGRESPLSSAFLRVLPRFARREHPPAGGGHPAGSREPRGEVRALLAAPSSGAQASTPMLRAALGSVPSAEVVDALNALPAERAARVVAALPFEIAAAVVDHRELAHRPEIFERLNEGYAAPLLEAMSPDQRAELFRALRARERDRLTRILAPATRDGLDRLLRYPSGTAAGIMTTAYVALPPSSTVGRALDRLAEADDGSLAFAVVLVVDPEDGRLLATLTHRELARGDRESRLGWLAGRSAPVSVGPLDRVADVERAVAKHDLLAVPVLGPDGRVLGLVTMDDVLDAAVRARDAESRRANGLALAFAGAALCGIAALLLQLAA